MIHSSMPFGSSGPFGKAVEPVGVASVPDPVTSPKWRTGFGSHSSRFPSCRSISIIISHGSVHMN